MKAIRPQEAEGISCSFQTRITLTCLGRKSKMDMLLVVNKRVPGWALRTILSLHAVKPPGSRYK